MILLFKYNNNTQPPKLTYSAQNSTNSLYVPNFINNIEILFSYCDWFTMQIFDLNELDISNFKIYFL